MPLPSQTPPPTTLWSARAGERVRIVGFDQQLAPNYRIRLQELGFHPGEEVHCVQAPALGAPRVYRVSNTLYSLDDQVAGHIHVSRL